jgi:hypothetical protein
VAFLLLGSELLLLLGTRPGNMAYVHMFLWLALACGVGYLVVGGDLDRNRGVVAVGIIGQLSVSAVLSWNWVAGTIYTPGLIPAAIDFVFAVAFIVFLWSYPYELRDRSA